MEDVNKLRQLKEFVDALAQGENPYDGSCIDDDSLLCDVRSVRFLFQISKVLDEVMMQDKQIIPPVKKKRKNFSLTKAQKQQIEITDRPITISEIISRMNAIIDQKTMKRLTFNDVLDGLIMQGYLKEIELEDGKHIKVATEKAKAIGIHKAQHINSDGETYCVNEYDRSAQRYVVEHLEELMKKG